MWLAVAASLPPVLLLLATGYFYTPWSWLPRIVMQFTAGVLACAAVRRMRVTDRCCRGAVLLSVLLGAAVVGILYLFAAHPLTTISDSSALVDVLFVPLVVTLTIGVGPLSWLLSTRLLVYGGQISFSLYMVHELVHTAWDWAAAQFGLTLAGYPGKLVVLGLLAITVAAAAVLFHLVEEPARRWMRKMVARDLDTNSLIEPPADPVDDEPQPVDAAPEARAKAVPARAM
jgi:peptidoglycan/LPS O-acetylase OafA/YrhL